MRVDGTDNVSTWPETSPDPWPIMDRQTVDLANFEDNECSCIFKFIFVANRKCNKMLGEKSYQ